MTRSLAGTGTLMRLMLRRDRVRLPVWIAAIVVTVVGSAASYRDTYPTTQDRQNRADIVDNPQVALLLGPGHGLSDYTYGAMTANELGGMTAVLFAFMGIFLITRHTRAEEEAGRTEMLRASMTGRHAQTAAALIVVCGGQLVAGLLLALGLAGMQDAAGSFLFAASVVSAGLVFAALTAVVAQTTEHARAVNGLTSALLGFFYLIRAIGDAGDNGLSWLSAIGWGQATRAYVDDRWWPLLLSLALTALLIAGAFALSVRRDVGAGFLPPRLGRPAASRMLVRPFGLALRLQRGSVLGWSAALLAFGALIGSLTEDAAESVAENETARRYLVGLGEVSLHDSLISMYLTFIAITAGAFAVASVLRLRGEETGNRAEPVLATATARWRWAGSHLGVALGGSVLILGLAGLGAGITSAATSGGAGEIPKLVGAQLAYAPAAWFFAALTLALYGFASRAAMLAWAVFGYAVFTGWLGPLLKLPDWMYDLSPYEHIPQVPAANLTVAPMVVLSLITAALIATGLVTLRRRDILA